MSDDDLDDDEFAGYSRDGRAFLKKLAVEKKQQQSNADASAAATQQWAEYIDQRILDIVQTFVGVVVEEERKRVRDEMKETVERRPKVIIYDPSEAMKKQIQEFAAPLLEELTEIKRELGIQRKGDVIDLPSLPRKRA